MSSSATLPAMSPRRAAPLRDAALARLAGAGPVVRTGEAARLLGLSVSGASHRLARLAEAGLAVRLSRSAYLLGEAADAQVVAALPAPRAGWLTGASALAAHGLTSAPEGCLFAATDGRSAIGDTVRGEIRWLTSRRHRPELISDGLANPAIALVEHAVAVARGDALPIALAGRLSPEVVDAAWELARLERRAAVRDALRVIVTVRAPEQRR